MLLRLSRPSPAALEKLVERARRTQPTYPEVGATADKSLPAGYRHDLYERLLGTSEGAFERAVGALRRWQAHIGAGVEIVPPDAPVAEDESVLLMLKLGALWTAAPCRVVLRDRRTRAVRVRLRHASGSSRDRGGRVHHPPAR